jgi:hypothetical protein
MSPEEIERTIQFILQHQAQFTGDFDKLAGKTDRIADGLIGLTAIVGGLADAQRLTSEQLRATNEQVKATSEQGGATAEHIKMVESHLNVVIEMFERHLREDHGAPPPS